MPYVRNKNQYDIDEFSNWQVTVRIAVLYVLIVTCCYFVYTFIVRLVVSWVVYALSSSGLEYCLWLNYLDTRVCDLVISPEMHLSRNCYDISVLLFYQQVGSHWLGQLFSNNLLHLSNLLITVQMPMFHALKITTYFYIAEIYTILIMRNASEKFSTHPLQQ